jgi:hypothetical protein
MLDPTKGVDDSGAWQAPGCSVGDDSAESTTSACWMMAGGGDAESMVDVVISTTGSSLLTSASLTWKFNVPIVKLKPLVAAEADLDERG